MSVDERDLLRSEIEAAFATVSYPGDEHLTACPCPECKEIGEYFRGRDWRGHRVADLFHYHAAITLLTHAAWHYFLPAFLLADIEDPVTADVISVSIAFCFKPEPWQQARSGQLSPEQRRAVGHYLLYLNERDGLEPEELTGALELLGVAPEAPVPSSGLTGE